MKVNKAWFFLGAYGSVWLLENPRKGKINVIFLFNIINIYIYIYIYIFILFNL